MGDRVVTGADKSSTDQTVPSQGKGGVPAGSRRIRSETLRAWLGPPTVKGFDDPKAFEKQHDEVSMTLRRVMLAIVTYSAFCLVTLFDTDLLLTEGKIKIPFVESPIRAIDFFYFGPLVLIAIALYMHIFVGYWQALSGPASKSLPFIFNMDTRVTRLLTTFLFYWLVPLMMLYFFWSAQPFAEKFPDLLPYLQFLLLVVATTFVWLGIRRRPLDKRSVIWNVGVWGLLVWVSGSGVFAAAQLTLGWSIAIPEIAGTEQQIASAVSAAPPATPTAVLSSVAPPETARAPAAVTAAPVLVSPMPAERPVPMPPTPRPKIARQVTQTALGVVLNRRLRLEGKDLRKVDLRTFNLVNASLARSNLGGNDLSNRQLMGADLNGADLTGANLVRADLASADLAFASLAFADLRGAILSKANLEAATLEGARMEGARLDGANLQRAILRKANLERANLRGADLTRAHLTGATLRGAHLFRADLTKADLRGAQGLRCEQLKKANNWEKSFRDDKFACGAPIPQYSVK